MTDSRDVTTEAVPDAEAGPQQPPQVVDTELPSEVVPDTTPPPSRPRRRTRWPRLGIQSKLLLMLLVTSIVSCLVVGIVGYTSGRDALRDKAFDQLTFLRNSRAREITREFNRLLNTMVLLSRGQTANDGVEEFSAGFDELADSTLSSDQDEALDTYYEDVFVEGLNRNLGTTSETDVFLPTSPAQRYLQAWYTAPHADFDAALADFDAAIAVDDAGDGSAWSAVHAEYHDYWRELVTRFNYEDVMLINPDGVVVYTAYKGVDLGTDVTDGPYSRTALGTVFEAAIESNAVDFSVITDFERYQPSFGVPSGFAASPIGHGGHVHGVLVLQYGLTNINAVMTGNEDWRADGLGDSGETYLVGPDHLMRSTSRLVVEDPERYEREAIAGGTPPDVAARARRVRGTVLIQEVDNEQVQRAFRGETGTLVGDDYLGNEALAAYMPVELGDLGLVVIAELDTSEAFEPVDDFTRRLVLATAAIIVGVAILSLLLAQVFSRPVKKMMVGVRQVAAGDLGATVESSSTDEFADLSGAFNDMSRSLQTKQELLDAERSEHERLLLTMMPETVAQRYRKGEETISEDHQDVAVVFADIVGFDDYAANLDSATSLAQLNDILRQFDEAAERTGVERVRTLRNGYLASCGLVLPRVDNALRAIDFAKEIDAVVQRFNATQGTALSLRSAVDTGKVTSGLVGRSSVLYDLWGEAVNLVFRVQGSVAQPGIFVTQRVYDRLRDSMTFDAAESVETATGTQQVWRLVTQ